jgi:A118 family predicted phage portal protein
MKRFYKELDIEDQNFIHDFSPALRNSEMSSRLQEIMRRIEENCGLSYGIISDPVEVAHTATEVKHSKERLMATVTSIQNALHAALNFTIQACSDLCDLYKITPAGDWELVCEWDDSVIESREEKSARALQELQNGLIDDVEYFVQTRGMSLEEATEYVNEIKKRKPNKPQGVDWFGGGGA